MKKLYLVDVSSMFFRAFYAIRMLNNSQGLPTNAIYGFLSMSIKLLRDIQPDYLVYCYDQKTPSFRKKIFDGYKANRREIPEKLIPQIPYIEKLTKLMGIPGLGKENYEADDIIGSLTKFGLENQLEVVIISGDKDFAQLVNERVTLFDTMKNKRYNVHDIVEKWGVYPHQFIDYLAITGDSSDNVPGVKGLGPKGAQTLLKKFESLDKIYENIDLIENSSQKKKLIEFKEDAYLSKKLVKIVKDLNLVDTLDDISLKPVNNEKLEKILDELEFSSFKKNLLGTPVENKKQFEKIHNKKYPSIKVKKISQKDVSSWLKTGDSIWVWKDPRQFFINHGNDCGLFSGELEKLGEVLNKKKLKWKGFDIKSIWREMNIYKGEVQVDVLLSAYLLKAKNIKNLDEIYQNECGRNLPEFPKPQDIIYALEECHEVLTKKLREQKMLPILQTMDLPLIEVLASMETKGVMLDLQRLSEESKELEKEIKELEKDIKNLAGEEFNIASPKQLSVILFEKMDFKKSKKTKTGYSTATDVLEKLTNEHPIARKIIDYRELSKLKSTYVDSLPNLVNVHSGRIHTIFNQASTSTGRLSSNHPNLQNIPIRTQRGKKVRKAFIVPKGMKMLSADYSQIELRILAHITQDKELTKAFNKDLDIHSWTASEIFSVPLEKITPDQRRMAKTVNFGIAYGQGVYGLSETLQIPRKQAKEIIENYFEKFQEVKTYMDQTIEQAKTQGYVETLFGRRRYLPELFSKNPVQRQFGERAAINAPIQGTASDLVKMVMLELHEHYPREILLQVHDELIFELPEKDIEDHGQRIKKIMENNVQLKVKLKVNISWGDNWAEAH